MKYKLYLFKSLLIILVAILSGCGENQDKKPNVVLIMADDMGYECLSTYGSVEYYTPVLDSLAANGMKFSNCISQPLCTPSRVKIMTGLYNYRNYDYFGHLASDQYTFGNLMKDAGYRTCISGKWQLNGLAYKDEIPYWNDKTRPNKFGFDEYCLWQLTRERNEGERFAEPLVEINGDLFKGDPDDYGPDLFCDFILGFIERNREYPFFVYYPMVLVHEPFVPTPDSKDWEEEDNRYTKDTSYFRDMVAYTDKIVGRISGKLRELGIDDNTLFIFTGDNGTHFTIYSQMENELIRGAKGNTIDNGIHVPLIAYWPDEMKKSRKGEIFDGLIEFSDFFPTFADIAGVESDVDGTSFYNLLRGLKYTPRETAFVHYDPRWGQRVNQYRNQFVMTTEYKLYQDGKFYNFREDRLEEAELGAALSDDEQVLRKELEKEIEKHPDWK